MKYIIGVAVLAAGMIVAGNQLVNRAEATEAEMVHVFKSAACVCCGEWIAYMEDAGFEIEIHETKDLVGVKEEMGVPKELYSCHSSVIDGRAVEGHAPVEAIRVMLQDPEIHGIGVGGMPSGAPGMQEDGSSYLAHEFTPEGETAILGRY